MEFTLLNDLVLIFGVSALSVLLLHKFKVPPLIGFIFAGVLIGPHGAGLISDTHDIERLAEIGVILLLFSVGIEFSLKKLLRIRNVVIFSGGAQVLLTIAVTAALWYPYMRDIRVVIFFGFITALSSTAIVMKSLSDSGDTASPHGRKMMGILIFQDLCVVPLMLITPMLAGQDVRAFDLLLTVLKAIGIIASVLIAARWVVPGFLHQVVRTRSRELFLITIIFICLGTALVTSRFGLSLALGAFLAGLVLSESVYAYQATAEILPFKDSFLGIFFVSIGMLMDPTYIADNLLLVTGAVLFIVIVKSLAATLSIFMTSSNTRAAIHAGIGLAQVGEFSFILAESGKRFGLMPEHLFQLFLSASVLTMAMTPFLIKAAAPISSRLNKILPVRKGKGLLHEIETTLNLTGHVIIVGFGLNGRNLAITLKTAGIPYIALDLNSETVRTEQGKGEAITYGDATRYEVLDKLGIERARSMVIAISDPTATRQIVSIARNQNPLLHILVRTRYLAEVDDLIALGANEVIPEEFETSVEIFAKILSLYNTPRNIINDYINEVRQNEYQVLRTHDLPHKKASEVPGLLSVIETERFLVRKDSMVNGMSIRQTDLRNKTGATIIAIEHDKELIQNPQPAHIILENDIIVLMGRKDELSKSIEYLNQTEER